MPETPAPAANFLAFVAVALFGFVVIELGPAFDAVHALVARVTATAGWVARVLAVEAALLGALAAPAVAEEGVYKPAVNVVN